jgi:BirA family transcriptional regulator, biotin operon repressor / biotin---[acetyl-CoA-carboxylase] ligase
LYKNFAKTQFIGKKVEYLTQCHSTNDEMSFRVKQNIATEGDIMISGFQTKGKGQRGNLWQSEPNKNLLFSLFLKPSFLPSEKIYLINVLVAVSLQKTLGKFIPTSKVEIKWPNDIYINDRKVAGVLIESSASSQNAGNIIVGIGLNVNQDLFEINHATSLLLEANKSFDLQEVLMEICTSIEVNYGLLKSEGTKRLLFDYNEAMRWRGEIHSYFTSEGEIDGEIVGINNKGMLMLKQNDQLRSYDVKEIKFIF